MYLSFLPYLLSEKGCQIYALDRDPTTKVYADEMKSSLLVYENGKFSDIKSIFKYVDNT